MAVQGSEEIKDTTSFFGRDVRGGVKWREIEPRSGKFQVRSDQRGRYRSPVD